MSKRGADRQITKDDQGSDNEGEQMEEQGGTWKPASDTAMAGRVIVKARRKGISAPTGQAMPAFNFGATMPAAPAAAAAAPAAAAPTPAAAEPAPMNALQRLAAEQAASSWSCPACETNNKKTDARCGACEEPNPNAPAASADKAAAPAAASAFTFGAAAPAAAEPQNALQKLAAKLASESWECPTCMTNNKMAAATCGACEEPNPNAKAGGDAAASSAAAPAASGFSFGSSSGVTFGAAPAASGVTFGGAASTSEVTFGAPVSTSSAPGVFSFGASEASATPLSFGSVPSFSFGGSAGAAPLASFGSVASGASAFGDSAAVPQFEASSAETLLQSNSEVSTEFKNKSKESTGEEDDEVHLRANTKVFQLKQVPIVKAAPEAISEVDAASAAGGAAKAAADKPAAAAADGEPERTEMKYVEIGSGELHVNSVQDPATGKTRARLVLREERTKRSVLNAPLFTSMLYALQNERYVRFHSLDLEQKMTTFMLKFKSKTEAQDVIRALDTCMDLIKA